jgi:predicted  nucleic acid-binding Zn-ribbon protein
VEELEALRTKLQKLSEAYKNLRTQQDDALAQVRKQKMRISYLEKEAREYKKTIELQALEIASMKNQLEGAYPSRARS